MATTRGRTDWGSHNPYYGSRSPRTRPTNAGRTNTGKRTMYTKMNRPGMTMNVPPKYRHVCDAFTWKINSYRTLYNQARGPAKYDRPSPTVLNTFANWINKGAFVQTVSKAQLNRWARTTKSNWNNRNPSPTICKNVLSAKFGKNTIKAVARTKTGSFMVATAPMWNGKWFTFPK